MSFTSNLSRLKNLPPPQRRPPGAAPARPAARCWPPRWLPLLLAGLPLLISACGEAPLPQRQLRSDDCLREVDPASLPALIRRCDAVVARFPRSPGPLNDRALLLSLAGRDREACAALARAHALARQAAPGSLDPQLLLDLRLRGELCRLPAGRDLPPAAAKRQPTTH